MEYADFDYSRDNEGIARACRMLAWARRYNLVRYKPKKYHLFAWIAEDSARYLLSSWKSIYSLQSDPQFTYLDWFDHVSYWKQLHTGLRLVVAQPYQSKRSSDYKEKIVRFTSAQEPKSWKDVPDRASYRHRDWYFRFSPSVPSWYGHGTTLIVVTDAYQSNEQFPYNYSDDVSHAEGQMILKLYHDRKLKVKL